MTLQDYAKYLLNVCGRRFTNLYRRHYLESTNALPSLSALLSYLRTQTASIYGYLQTRFAGDPTSGIPSITPTSPLTFANLLTNIQKLATRKIDAGTSTQVEDGVSLASITLFGKRYNVTKLVDNQVTTMSENIKPNAIFPNLKNIELNELEKIEDYGLTIESNSAITSISLPKLKRIENGGLIRGTNIEVLNCPELEYAHCRSPYGYYSDLYLCSGNNSLREVYMPKLKYLQDTNYNGVSGFSGSTNIEKWVVGKLETFNIASGYFFYQVTKLIHFEIGQGTDINFYVSCYNPTIALMSDPTAEGYENLVTQSMIDDLNATLEEGQTQYTLADFPNNLKLFIENFYVFFAKRLQSQTTAGAKTLRLSSAVATAINATAKDGTNVYTYITSIKKWTIATA